MILTGALSANCRRLTYSKVDVKDLWAAVRSLTGRRQEAPVNASITAKSLNHHYATISTDSSYEEPLLKQTVSVDLQEQQQCFTEYTVFRILDKLCPTAMGLDNLPSWFLRLAAPVFSRPIAELFNLALNTSTVPHQWKRACIRPIQKVPAPKQHADFRPIYITPVMTRVMEQLVVRQYLYPSICTLHCCRLHLICSLMTSLPSIPPAQLQLP